MGGWRKVLSQNREHDIQSTTPLFLRVERPFFLCTGGGKGSPRTGGRCARLPGIIRPNI